MSPPQRKLFLIPCCASKKPNEHSQSPTSEPLEQLVSQVAYSAILKARKDVLSRVRQNKKYLSNDYEKNQRLEPGPDFGGHHASGLFLPARERYEGRLYSNAPALSSWNNPGTQILILSALYGPLHPLSHIQDYNLEMRDSPAYGV